MTEKLNDKIALLSRTLVETHKNAERLLAIKLYPRALDEIHECMNIEREIKWACNLIDTCKVNTESQMAMEDI